MISNIIENLEAIAPVSRTYTKIVEPTKIIVELANQRPAIHADNDFDTMISRYRIHLFCKENFIQLKKQIIRTIKQEALQVTVQAELYEDDTSYHHIVIDFSIREEL